MSGKVQNLCDEEKKKIEALFRVTNSLRDKKLLESGQFPIGHKIKADSTEGILEESIDEPNEEFLLSALVEIRKLILNDEPANLMRLHNVIYQKIDDEEPKKQLGALNKDYKKSLNKGFTGYSVRVQTGTSPKDVVKKTPQDSLDVWLHGIYFHDKEEVAESLNKELVNVEKEMRIQFLLAIRATIITAFNYEKFIKDHFGDQL
ncbi:MAG: hypothetical protein GY865_02375 [candidate division Zixibacteria bacterium]|nr:hypothetical protein [candidate division Zixibacteria bacterium]